MFMIRWTAAVLLLATALPARSQSNKSGPRGAAILEGRFQAAVSHYKSGQYQLAARELERLVHQLPANFEVQELLGLVYSAGNQDQKANPHFAEAVRLKPDSVAARANLAVNLAHLGKASLAEAQFRAALQKAPGDFKANQEFGEFYLHVGRIGTAIPYLENAQRIDPSSYGNGYNLALAYEKTGRLDQARQQIQRLLAWKKTAELHNLLGEVEEKSGNFVTAANEYQQAALMDPSEANIFDWGSEFLLHHTWNPAIRVFSQGLERYPNSARLALGLGLALYWRGEYDDAVKALMRATDLAPSDPHTYYFLSKAYDRAPREADQVMERFRRFAELHPQDARADYYYAMSLWKGKETASSGPYLGQVEALLKKAVRLDPSLAKAHLELGNVYSQQLQYAEAVPEYQRALKADPKLGDACYRLGQAYVHLGQKTLAQKEFLLHQQLYARHLAEVDQEREQVRQFVYSMRGGQSKSEAR